MPTRKPSSKIAAKKPATKKAAPAKARARKPAAPKAVAKILVTRKALAKKAPAPASADPEKPKPAKSAAPRTPVQKTRVVVPIDFYEPNKDAIKAPFKEHTLKWNFLGEGKGLYKREDGGVHCFTQFKDDGVHYSIWGADKATCEKILASWRKILGEEGWLKATTSGEQAVEAEKAQEVSEATRLWQLAMPQRRPGEPDLFYDKRVAEWQAKKPA